MVPQDAPEQPAPETAQEIAGFGFEFGTGVSVAARLALAPTPIDDGPLSVKIKLLVTVTVAVAFFDASAVLVTVILSAGGAGRFCGAVKTPLEVTAPHAGPAQPAPLGAQITSVSGFPAEIIPAWNICWAPNSVAALVGDRLTLISLMMVMTASAVFVGSEALAA
jgi:hypothetical protein